MTFLKLEADKNEKFRQTIEKSNKHWGDEIKAIKKAQAESDVKFQALKIEHEQLKSDHNQLQATFMRSQQDPLNSNIIVRGIPETDGENLHKIIAATIKLVDDKLKVKLSTVSRIGKKVSGTNRQILVNLASSGVKSQLMALKLRKVVKCSDVIVDGKAIGSAEDFIYFGEHLASLNAHIFFIARQLVKKGQLVHAFTRNGAVYVRKSKDDEPQLINNQNQFAAVLKPPGSEAGSDDADESLVILKDCITKAKTPRPRRNPKKD